MVSEGVASAGFGAGCTSGFLIGGSGSCADGGGYCGEGLISCAGTAGFSEGDGRRTRWYGLRILQGRKRLAATGKPVNFFPSLEKVGIRGAKVRREDLSQKEEAKLRPPVSQQNGPFDSELETDAKIPRLIPRPLRWN